MADRKKIETTDEARQGSRGIPVLVILVVSLLLAAIAWIVWWTFSYSGGNANEPPAQTLSSAYYEVTVTPPKRSL
jgi:flagellar basal body-associated protein FliL